jgi:hypothetical protein
MPYTTYRWLFTFLLCLFYLERSYGMSYYIVTYLIGFYVLQLIVNYVTPKGLEDNDEEEEGSSMFYIGFVPYLSDSQEEESRPIVPSMS